ncbi:MAG: response regulator [Bacteroidota bacterium]
MLKNFASTIFLVDDDELSLTLYQQFLKQLGYTNIHLFYNGNDCLVGLDTLFPDIIFLDYNMEDLTGIEVLKQIRKFNPAIIVLFISGQEDIDVAVNTMRQGALDYMVKSSLTMDKMAKLMDRIESLSVQETAGEKKSLLRRLFS